MENWVCPNDRQLALRAKLGAGWSVHSSKTSSFKKDEQLTADEQEHIMQVMRRANQLEEGEQERIGHLVNRVDNMKKNAMGDGVSQCVLCSDEFGILGATPACCDDCKKAVCSKCSIDTVNKQGQTIWLCKICSERRELWKRSGAWFYKGLPKFTFGKKTVSGTTPDKEGICTKNTHTGVASHYNSWSQNMQKANSYQDEHYSSDSEDEVSIRRRRTKNASESALH